MLKLKLLSRKKNWKNILNIKTSKRKQKEMILFISNEMRRNPNLGKTVLAKMMYFSETNYFLKTGKPIAGTIFIKEKYGPLPKNFYELLDVMKRSGLIQIVRIKRKGKGKGKRIREVVIPLREPNIDIFSDSEIMTIEDVINRLRGFDADYMKKYSHQDVAWIWTSQGEEIDYRLTAYRKTEVM